MDFTISLILYLTLHINLGPGAQCGVLYGLYEWELVLQKSSIQKFVITEKAPTRAFSWLKAATTAFTFKTLC